MNLNPILVITRPKKSGVGTHWGVFFPDGYVFDFNFEIGFRATSIEGFADGVDVTIVREIPWEQAGLVRARLAEVVRQPPRYDIFSWNCETFAQWLTSGEAKSEQISGALTLGAIFAFLAVAK